MAVGTTRPTLRAAILREMAPDPDDFISSTATSNGTTTSLIDSTLISFRRKPEWFDEKVIYIPGSAAADQTRYIQDFDQDTGTIVPDRAWSATSVVTSGTAYEVFPLLGPRQVHDAINDALRRAEQVVWLKLHPEAGVVDYNLSLKVTALRVHNRNKHLNFTEGTTGDATATIPEGIYDADALADEIEDQMNDAATDNTYTVTYSRTTLKFTIARATGSATIGLEWNTGANTATTIGTLLAFTVSADDTGATSYSSDTTVARSTWLAERRQVGTARVVPTTGLQTRMAVQIDVRDHANEVYAYIAGWGATVQDIEISMLRPYDELSDENTQTSADLTWIKAGAIHYLYKLFSKKATLGAERDTYKLLEADAEQEWLRQCLLHQGRLGQQLYAGV